MARALALFFGIVYTIVGIAGFVPGIGGTAGIEPHPLLGIAEINLAHNVIHLAIGLWGLWAASDIARATGYCQIVGIVLLAIGLLGFFVPSGFGLIPLGGNDPWLHIISGVLLAFGGFAAAGAAGEA